MITRSLFFFVALLVLLASRPALSQSSGTPAALFKASEAGNVVEIRKALGSGIAVDAPDPDGWTALMVAASAGKLQAAQLLVKSGADVNAVSKKGETPLMAAVLSGNIAMVKFLLSEGADKTAATAQGLTAADIAERSKKPEIARLLRPAGSKPVAAEPSPPVKASGSGENQLMEKKVSAAAAAFQAGNFDDAAKRFQEIVTIEPAHALAWHFLGQSLDKTGKKEEARNAFKKSLELQPTGQLAERNKEKLSRFEKTDFGIRDKETGLVWAPRDNGGDIAGRAAYDYCKNLGPGWILPTKRDLLTLVRVLKQSGIHYTESKGYLKDFVWFWTREVDISPSPNHEFESRYVVMLNTGDVATRTTFAGSIRGALQTEDNRALCISQL